MIHITDSEFIDNRGSYLIYQKENYHKYHNIILWIEGKQHSGWFWDSNEDANDICECKDHDLHDLRYRFGQSDVEIFMLTDCEVNRILIEEI
jgi:hypothetical protein